MELEYSLKELDLTSNEVEIYAFLLKKGLSTGPDIFKNLNLDKSSCYEALANLEKKELVYVLGQKRNQRFGAVSAERLLEMVDEKRSKLTKVESNITSFIKDIDAFTQNNYKNQNIQVLSGDNSYQQWTEAKHSSKKGSTIREFLSYSKKKKFIDNFPQYATQTPKDRVKKGINMKSLSGEADWKEVSKDFPEVYKTSKKLLKELRILPNEPKMSINANFATFDNKTSLLRIEKGEFFGIIIEDYFITDLMNNMFDFIWNFSKEV
jgi:sugar-specific transcriptional regulator TrmB